MEQHIGIRVLTAAIWMYSCHKRYRGVFTGEKHFGENARTRLLCVFANPPELCLQNRKGNSSYRCPELLYVNQRKWKTVDDWLSNTANMRTIQLCWAYGRIRAKSKDIDLPTTTYGGRTHAAESYMCFIHEKRVKTHERKASKHSCCTKTMSPLNQMRQR